VENSFFTFGSIQSVAKLIKISINMKRTHIGIGGSNIGRNSFVEKSFI